jgi:hypothetical protein
VTYHPKRGAGSATFTEFTCTTNTVNNSAFRWNSTSKRSTGTTSVSVDTDTGGIMLPSGACYWLIASLDVTRSSTANSIRAKWVDANNVDLLSTRGGSRIDLTADNTNSANQVAQLCIDVPAMGPSVEVFLKEHSGNTQTPNTSMSLIIMEVR